MIRQFVEKGLAGDGITAASQSGPNTTSGQSDASLDRQIADRETAIAQMPDPSGPSPEAALAKMDKALAENDLIDMKNEKTRRKSTKRKAGKVITS